jgi:hypothetical protein
MNNTDSNYSHSSTNIPFNGQSSMTGNTVSVNNQNNISNNSTLPIS